MAERINFPGISADAFVSDADRWALDKLKMVPLLPMVIRKFYEIGFDRWYYCMNMAMSVRCGPNQYPTLYKILQDSCKVLDMPEPELYLTNNPFPNAWTGGIERPYITLRSSIVDTMTDDQLYYLIGHELGHIKAEHVLYFNVGVVLVEIINALNSKTLGASDLVTTGLYMAFFEWVRQAEYSADRAGLLVSQSFDDCSGGLIGLTAGPNRLSHEMNREAFMEQARAYNNMDPLDQVGKAILFYLFGWTYSHPFPVARVQELERWYLNGTYQQILAGDYPRMAEAKSA